MDSSDVEASGSGSVPELVAGVRLVVLNLPEDEGEGLGFRLTRTLWDPYPWVREVVPASRADNAGLKTGDCLLQADGKDLLGLPVGQVAGLIRGDGAGRGVSLLVWNCGVDPNDDPELLWSCGGGSRGEKSRRALAGVVRALSCCVCAATAVRALNCARSHLYCEACWKRLERCALCRETLPAKDSPYARNLVAEQVFEAIATEYELKETMRKPTESASAVTSPNRSPNHSPFVNRKGQYHHLINKNKTKKAVQFNDKLGQNYASDPNLHRTINQDYVRRVQRTTNFAEISHTGNTGGTSKCNCQCSGSNSKMEAPIPRILIENADDASSDTVQHKLVTRLRQASSLADLNNVQQSTCLTGSLNNINLNECNTKVLHSTSMENIKASCGSIPESASVFVLTAPPIYVLSCDHNNK